MSSVELLKNLPLVEWLPRIFVAAFMFALFFMRFVVPNPLQSIWLQGTRLDRFVSKLRLVIDWKMFEDIGPYFEDLRIRVVLASNQEMVWYLMRDRSIGPITISTDQARLTLTHFIRERPEFLKRIHKSLHDDFMRQGEPIAHVQMDLCKFESFHDQETIQSRQSLIGEEAVYLWTHSEAGGR